ncbi:transcriptional regulator [Nonlabens ulvanivorans]|uniref:Transcriptional regulator n=1 Tax=Nonlabens ulvanivorans TaxID=906888 RepID=A0A081DBH9_NONUL|nr:AraC family transcriptional regulator [Nonlabens ulvanivorans]GAK76275.1 transcriptional regulator [Nonlabens ulvanivorans]GAL01255.1 transcriptional regulator [Nonlabens ulvanivorans]GAL76543.1 transcriptional regulator [Nonlabens ulvanivorans]
MLLKKPTLKKVNPDFGNSIFVQKSTTERSELKPFWHFHPEIELVYVNEGQGKRHIGNHMSYYNDSQLLLIGSMLPHIGYTDRPNHGSELLVQFLPNFLGGDGFFNVPEMEPIKHLFERAKNGLLFKQQTQEQLGDQIHKLHELKGFARTLLLLDILNELAITDDYEILNAESFTFETELQDNSKTEIIYKYINQNFQNHIPLEEIASQVSMTVPAFCRYFKKTSGKTFTKIVNEYRVVHATKLLSETQLSITDICFDCGFNNFSHFNKIFKEFTGKSASKYRQELKQILQ